MKGDNMSQLGDHDAPFCEQQYRHGSCYISLFKFKSFDQFNTPQTASNFRHLLSCGTIGRYLMYSSGGIYPKWKTRPIGEACLVLTLRSKAKKETEVQSPGCNVLEGR